MVPGISACYSEGVEIPHHRLIQSLHVMTHTLFSSQLYLYFGTVHDAIHFSTLKYNRIYLY